MEGKLVPETDLRGGNTGKTVCVSCNQWNCWHRKGDACDITGCQCSYGHPEPDVVVLRA